MKGSSSLHYQPSGKGLETSDFCLVSQYAFEGHWIANVVVWEVHIYVFISTYTAICLKYMTLGSSQQLKTM